MYLEPRKPYRKPVTHHVEVDLLMHFPFGGLIGGELLPHTVALETSIKTSGNAKLNREKKNLKYHW